MTFLFRHHASSQLGITVTFLRFSSWVFMAALLIALLGGCARNRAEPFAEEMWVKTTLGTITLVPVEPPAKLYVDNRSAPVIGWLWVGLANVAMDKDRTTQFNEVHGAYRQQLGQKMTDLVAQELRAMGYKVRIAARDEVHRDKDNRLEFNRFTGQEAVLDIQFDEVGIYSARTSVDYVPSVVANVYLVQPGFKGEHLLETQYLYGAYASSNGDGYILADPKFAFDSFEKLIGQPDLVKAAFDEGVDKIIKNLSQDFSAHFRSLGRASR